MLYDHFSAMANWTPISSQRLQPYRFSTSGSSAVAFALISEITDNVFFRTEYLLNEEDTNGPGFSNNELLLRAGGSVLVL